MCSTTRSCGGKRDTDKVGISFAIFETVGYDTKSQSLNFACASLEVLHRGKNPGHINDFCNQTAAFLLFNSTPRFMDTCYDFPQDVKGMMRNEIIKLKRAVGLQDSPSKPEPRKRAGSRR